MDLFPEIFATRRSRITATSIALSTDIARTIASFNYGGIGTYVLALWTPSGAGQTLSPGDTVGGAALANNTTSGTQNAINASAVGGGFASLAVPIGNLVSLGLSGTWRSLTVAGGGGSSTSYAYLSLFVRIA